jgi:putative transposase
VGCSPVYFNSDQGTQFICEEFVSRLLRHGIRISRDGRGRWLDNVFVERLWRTVKHEEVFVKDNANPREARRGLVSNFHFYNYELDN